ncbi:hypothetical protein [Microvirga aerophila]|uniref:Uncharacterized protein n=1 Tax=Microvirga aerophila TaxID=670291 RepID=A0A512BNK5_9HYPH|nr:hypothetical protein [Microvirga aerophila]GEO13539.1 hypothetical protein MAE02_12350 [Microvirga aerophila]
MSDKTGAARGLGERDNSSDAPKADWIPLDRAAFYFVPAFTGTGQDWVNAIVELAKNYFGFWGLEEWDLVPYADEVFVVRVGNLELVVDPQEPSFWLRPSNREDGPVFETAFDLAKSPQDFCDAVEELQIKLHFSDAGEALTCLAIDLRQRFGYLEWAITNGHAEVFARRNSPLAPFSKVHPDQWRYFALPRTPGEPAEGPNGEKLFSVYIAAGVRKSADNTVKKTIGFQPECMKWLIREMQASPNTQPHPKEYYRAEARKRWGNISLRGFESMWTQAKESAGATGWGMPGRPRKTAR